MHTPILAITNANTHPAWVVVLVALVVIAAVWDGVWKLIAMWKSARHKQMAWFICLAVFNTVGILPILYILLFQKKDGPIA
jgi:predicted permease